MKGELFEYSCIFARTFNTNPYEIKIFRCKTV